MLAEQEAVVGPHDEHGVVPQLEPVHLVEDVAEAGVAHAQQRCVVAPALIDECLLFGHGAVGRPVEQHGRAILKKLWIEVLVLALGEKRLVRVKGLDLQKPVVLRVVAADELDAGLEGLRLGLVFLAAHVLSVDVVLAMPHAAARIARVRLYGRRIGHLPDPRVALLAAEELPSVVLGVVGSSAGLPVVVVVANEVR